MPLWVLLVTLLLFLVIYVAFFFFLNLKVIMEPTKLYHPGKLRQGILSFGRLRETLWNPLETCKYWLKPGRHLCPGPAPMRATEREGEWSWPPAALSSVPKGPGGSSSSCALGTSGKGTRVEGTPVPQGPGGVRRKRHTSF